MLPLSKRRAIERITGLVSFTADYPGAIVVPAHSSNYRQFPNTPKGWVLHTPEERADDIEVTPYYFQTAGLEASTHYYLDNDGDVFQMVQEKWSPIANGVLGKPYPAWARSSVSLNSQTLNVEIEGQAATIGQTLNDVQFASLVRLITHRAQAYGIPLDRAHIIGHYEVANNRSDPGATFPWDRLMQALEGEDMKPFLCWDSTNQRVFLIGPFGSAWITQGADVKALEALYGPMKVALTEAAIKAIGAAA